MSKYVSNCNENWVSDDNTKSLRKQALKAKKEYDEKMKGKKEILLKHETIRNTTIIRYE